MNHPSQPRRRGSRLLAAVAAAAALSLGLAAGATGAGFPVPAPAKPATTAPEPLAKYAGQLVCTSYAQPGTLALSSVIKTTYAGYGSQTIGTTRACSQGGKSEHKDGRALDWMLDSTDPADKALADSFLAWLVGPDAQGVVAGNARRLGVMYVIWNRQSWNAYDRTPAWVPYTGANPHTDHIHISLSWDGALKRTSFWTGIATTRYDYGPCQVYIGEPPVPGPHYERCPTPRYRPGVAFPKRWDADTAADVIVKGVEGRLTLYPGTGTGGLRSGALIGRGWSSLSMVSAVGDLDRDGRRDLVARDATGTLLLYRGSGTGTFLGATPIGAGWGTMNTVVGAGDLDQDGVVDVLARGRDNVLKLYRGTGRGGLAAGVPVADTTGADLVRGVGDWDGDGLPDVITREASSGRLSLWSGDGRGGLSAPRVIGTGWSTLSTVVGTGDFDGDGRSDLLVSGTSGRLTLYRGDGTGGFAGTVLVSKGWAGLTLAN